MTKTPTTAAIVERLEAGLEARIAAFCGDWEIAAGRSVKDCFAGSLLERPLNYFLEEVVFDDGDTYGLDLSWLVDDADSESWDGRLVVVGDYIKAQRQSVPAMLVRVDWGALTGAEGLRMLAAEIYDAFRRVAKAAHK